jgi:hypothetical protein
MTNEIFLVALAIAAAVLALLPLARKRGKGGARTPAEGTATGRPHPTAPDELAELELDRAMGRVSEEDFRKWKGELEADIATGPTGPPALPAPAEVPPPGDARERAEALVRQWRAAPRPTCPSCGQRPEPGARFCSNCGAPLAGQAPTA